MNYPTNFKDLLHATKCNASCIEITVRKFHWDTHDYETIAEVFEPFLINYPKDVAYAIARPYVKRMCELHPEWKKCEVHASVWSGDGVTGTLQDIYVPCIWHEIYGTWEF